jgi:hypothetical protein
MVDGAVLLDMLDGRYFELNRVGSLFWSHLEQPSSIVHICETLAPTVGATREILEADLTRLVDDLLRAGLVELVPLSGSLAR